jgi:hypothetical protein
VVLISNVTTPEESVVLETGPVTASPGKPYVNNTTWPGTTLLSVESFTNTLAVWNSIPSAFLSPLVVIDNVELAGSPRSTDHVTWALPSLRAKDESVFKTLKIASLPILPVTL